MKRKEQKVVVIGAGIAGLTLGCYLQINGFEVQICEAHNIPGGLCTSWQRKGYKFDGCIHSTIAPSNKYRLSRWYSELIDFEKIKYHFYDELTLIKFEDGREFHFYTNPDKLEKELLAIAPEDEKFIKSLMHSTRVFEKYDLSLDKPIELWNPLDYMKRKYITAPYLSHLTKWCKSLKETIEVCKSPVLKQILNQDFFTRYPFYFFILSLGQMDNKSVGYPIGGSLNFAKLLEQKFKSLGGKINYNSRVMKVLVENDTAKGVMLENGERIDNQDIVVSAADGYETLFNMLDGKYIDRKIKNRYENDRIWPSMVLVSLGVARSFENEAPLMDIRLKEKVIIDDKTDTDAIPITIYNFDPTLAPSGKTCIRVILHTHNFDYWNNLKASNIEKYNHEKNRIGNEIVEILDKHLGDIKSKVEVMDVSTPATFARYTSNWKGSIQGWEWKPGLIPESIKHNIPKLKHFYMAGQWVAPGGGVSGAFINARDLSRIICKRNHINFKGK